MAIFPWGAGALFFGGAWISRLSDRVRRAAPNAALTGQALEVR